MWCLALLYAALTVALAYPLARRADDHVLSAGPDTDLVLWALSWDVHAFVHQPLAIFDANIFHPRRRTLAYAENMIGSAVFAAPVLWLTGNPVLAMNVVALLSCVLCGIGASVLARRAGVGWLGAALGGLVFAFAPPRFLRLDQLFLATIAWIPFGLASLHAYLDTGNRVDLRMAAAFFTLQALTSGHGAVFLAVAAAGLIAYRVMLGTPVALAARVRDLGATGALLLAPVVLVGIAYARVQAEIGLKRSLGDWWIVSPASFLASPAYVHDFLLRRVFPGAAINEHAGAYLFPGYLPLLLALAALLRPYPLSSAARVDTWRRAAWAADLGFIAAAAIAMLASIQGPFRVRLGTATILSARQPWRAWSAAAAGVAIRIGIARRAPFRLARPPDLPRRFTAWLSARRRDPITFYFLVVLIGVWLSIGSPLGLWPFVYWLPGFNFIRASSRFMLLAVLGLSVLAGAGFESLARRRAASARGALAGIAGLLLVAEFAAPLGPVPYRVTIPKADRWLAQQPRPFAVAEVPLPDPAHVWEFEKRQSEYMLHSTAHWQKTVHGWSGIQPPGHVDLYYKLTRFPDEDSVRALTDFGVTYVIVHAELYAPDEWTAIQRRLAAFRDRLELRYADDTARVYLVTSPARQLQPPTVSKRQRQRPLERHVFDPAEPLDADGERGLGRVRAQTGVQPIPAREQAGTVRVDVLAPGRVMDAVQPRGDDQQGQAPLDVERKLQVAVVKDHRQHEQMLPDAKSGGLDAQQEHLRRAESGGEGELAEMKAQPGGAVEIPIDVMHCVESPQERDPVSQPVPDAERAIEPEKPQPGTQRRRQRHSTQQTASALRQSFGGRHNRPLAGRRHRARQERDGQIADDPPGARLAGRAKRAEALDEEQRSGGRAEPQRPPER